MLVVDPRKRLTLTQIGQHAWMQEASLQARQDPLISDVSTGGGVKQSDTTTKHHGYSEQILSVMHSLNIDKHKTIEASVVSSLPF